MKRLYKELESFSKEDYYPFHMPGHKRNPLSVNGDFPIDRDITEIDGFDNLHHPEGIIKEAQENLAKLYGARESFFSVNGSTAALLSAISASVKKGGQLLAARNCHKAVYHAIYLRNLVPTYIYSQSDPVLGINGGIRPSDVEKCLKENKNIEAVLITSPTYDGVVSDVKTIAEIAHKYGIPLIVDEAHGAHFRYSGYFPMSAVEAGADVVIQSFHKTLPAMTQTAVLHLCSDRADREKIKRFMGIYQSSSPSYILMASLDACVDKMAQDGRKMFEIVTKDLSEARERLEKCRFVRLVKADDIKKIPGVFDYDRSKLILSTENSRLNGPELSSLLYKKYHIQTEMSTEDYVLALAAAGDTREGFLRLCEAIEEIDYEESLKKTEITKKESPVSCGLSQMKSLMTIAQAMEEQSVSCPIEESIGKISAEFAYLYPPGIPIIVPGEQITGLFIRNVRRYMEQGLNLQGLCDNTNKAIRIVKE